MWIDRYFEWIQGEFVYQGFVLGVRAAGMIYVGVGKLWRALIYF